jgi:hypothetical protein
VSQREQALGFGQATILRFGISVIIFAFFLIANLKDFLQFNTAVAFLFIWVVSLMFLGMVNRNPSLSNHVRSVDAFWQTDPTVKSLRWIGISLGGIFAVVALSVTLNSPLIGIGLSGEILMVAFVKTNSVLVPVLAHGIYNSFVTTVQATGLEFLTLFNQSPILVPKIDIGIAGISNLFSEIIWQFMLVATAEELMKVAVLVFVVIMLKGRFEKGNQIWIGGGIAVVIWTMMHTVQALGLQ